VGMLMHKNDETIDLLDSFPKYEKYKKLYGRGYNFSFKFIITPETRGDETPGLNYNRTVDWWELRYVYKVSRVDLVELIEKKSIIHTYKSPDSDTKMYRGKINFVDREPTEEEWKKKTKELKESNKKFDRKLWLIVGVIILIIVVYFNK
jgi:hypothetical protein